MSRPAQPVVASALTTDKTHLPATSLSRVTPTTRARAAERGEAMADGSFPVRDGADLRRALNAFGRAKDKGAAKRHILRRAKALGKVELLPESWRTLALKEFAGTTPLVDSPVATEASKVDATLAAKTARHNSAASRDRQVSPAKLKVVFERGLKAYDGRRNVTREQYAHARVNAFLRLLARDAPDSPTYDADDDLLPASHPRALSAPPPFAEPTPGDV